jgi:CBS domain-containing membrane protein
VFGNNLRVRDVMTPDVMTLERNEKLTAADDIMRLGRIRHLPVVDENGALVGILTQRDLFHNAVMRALGYGQRAAAQARETLVIKEAMHTDVISVTPDTPLRDAARLMLQRKIGCLPVLEGQRIVGIITEADFVALVAEDAR